MRDNVPLVNTTRTTLQNDGSLIIHPYKREDAGRIFGFFTKDLITCSRC